ncbi:efflux RND transporter periplasmic adaptor subunit [Acidovorax cavernicola]|uniref:Efflux RND transporter periplasmic adaptor subunit n=2 Tax=Acidovorax cavernicola TaxID=1675792 RepID=A0A9X8D7A4_9BURK|nr:efflux RND transporter periplasmic adaptor subunit [Acidovorax cavernicola]
MNVNEHLMKPSRHTVLRAIVLLSCALGGAMQAGAQPAPAAAPPRSAPGNAAPVRFLVVAAQESVLSASAPGRFAKVPVSLGDTVRAGQVLASYECDEIQARRAAARAEHEAAKVQYVGKLKLQGLQSAAEIEVELAAANVNKAQSQVRIFDAQIAQCNFVAPFAGKVARVHVKVGQGVNPGAPVVELVGNGPLKARMNVPSQWLAWLKTGQRLEGAVDETGGVVALKVTRVSGRVDAVSQTIEIEAELVGDGVGQVLPGMSGQVRAPASKG